MSVTDYQNLNELLDVADLAVRAASELRHIGGGDGIEDREALAQAADFLDRAKLGGDFIADSQAANLTFTGTLKPLNWAVDTYLSIAGDNKEVDYHGFATYLDKIEKVVSSPEEHDKESIADAVSFLESLGRILRSRIMRRIQSKNPEDVQIGTTL